MATSTVILDACVLYPAPLRDLLLWLAVTGLCRPRWTEMIHQEWMESLLKERPDLARNRLERTRELMNQAVPDCLVAGHEGLIPGLSLPDPDDRHVLAAAIHGCAETIVTYNLTDFPATALTTHGIRAQHPDEFIAHLLDIDFVAVCTAVKKHRESLRNPPKTVEEYLATLAQLSLPRTVVELTAMAELL
jgi:hypothetical protein